MVEPRRICLLGGSGFVGSRLAARLAGRGHEIVVPTRNLQRSRHLLVLPTVRLQETDISEAAALEAVLDGCDVVVNLVGILNERGRHGAGFRKAHSQLAAHLVSAATRQGLRKLVQVSALNADAGRAPSFYLRSKGEAEDIVRASSLAWTVLRPSVIFGPGDSFTNRFASLLRLLPGVFPLAMAQARFAPVHVDNVVEAIHRAATDPATDGKVYELCGPRVLSLGEIVQLIARELGLRRRVLPLPRWASRLQAAICDFVPGKPFSTDNYLSLTLDSVCSTDGLAALGIEPESFETGLTAALAGSTSRAQLARLRGKAGPDPRSS